MSNGIVLPRHRKLLDKAKEEMNLRPCTCHPDDKPPVPCAKKYALSYCKAVEEGRCQAYELIRDPSEEMISAGLRVDFDNEDERSIVINLWHAMISKASPPKSK